MVSWLRVDLDELPKQLTRVPSGQTNGIDICNSEQDQGRGTKTAMKGRLEKVLVRRSSNRCGRHLHSALSTVPPSLMGCVWMVSEWEMEFELWSSPGLSCRSFGFNVLSCK